MNYPSTNVSNTNSARDWIKKMAIALPVFFLIKGLLWLAVPLVFAIYKLN